jgi:hypothetical protein
MASDDSNKGLPIPYVTAVWSGMSLDDIRAGLAAGSVLPPLGITEGWGADSSLTAGTPGPMQDVDALLKTADEVQKIASDFELAEMQSKTTAEGDARSQISGWFHALDPSLASETFDALWNHAGTDDDSRADA